MREELEGESYDWKVSKSLRVEVARVKVGSGVRS